MAHQSGNNYSMTAANSASHTSGQDYSITSSNGSVTITGKQSIVLKVGGSTITIDGQGIHHSANGNLNLNANQKVVTLGSQGTAIQNAASMQSTPKLSYVIINNL